MSVLLLLLLSGRLPGRDPYPEGLVEAQGVLRDKLDEALLVGGDEVIDKRVHVGDVFGGAAGPFAAAATSASRRRRLACAETLFGATVSREAVAACLERASQRRPAQA